ncbi:MAG: TIGR02206 family membrane protein [Oscillospiraceae bacterium]|nr:TIGR02206 family membrane protein [Oscillospiraceae bacterium]
MSVFWYTKETMDKLCPDYIRFEHFSPLHLGVTAAFILIIIAAMLFYRRLDEKKRQKFLNVMAVLLILDEIWKHAFIFATGQWEWGFLPLHLCSINIFVCVWHTFKRDDISAEALYALCLPGAIIALLMPTWTNLPLWNAMSLHSNSVHLLLAMYPMLLLAGGFRPNIKRLPKVALMLLCEVVPIFFLNKVLDTNFFFLNGTAGNPLLGLLAEIFGKELYFIGLPVLLAFVWAAMYLPWFLTEKKSEKQKA